MQVCSVLDNIDVTATGQAGKARLSKGYLFCMVMHNDVMLLRAV